MVERRVVVTHRGTGDCYGPRDFELREIDSVFTPVMGSSRLRVRTFAVSFRGGFEKTTVWQFREFNTKEERQQWFERMVSSPRLRRVWWRRRVKVPDSLDSLAGQALTQVWFVHDYLQLTLEDSRLTCEATPELVTTDGRSLRHGEPGYADSLVALIGSRVTHAEEHSDGIRLDFAGGTALVLWESEGTPEIDNLDAP